ncbi:MAG TPA: tetratricopeptide repeat protein [Burkholderiales bacterium]|nr:tetratricopeptide repeat protein [Burkholderiales bacterium]
MSLINQMLRDLDKRHAPQGAMAGPATEGMAQHTHSVPRRAFASDFFWRAMAVAMLFAVAWVAWVAWQLMPRPVVTELALESQRGKAAPGAAPPTSSALPPVKAEVVTPSTPKPEAPASAPAPKVSEAPQKAGKPSFDMLRLATELTTPVPQRRASPRPAAKAEKSAAKAAAARPARAAETAELGTIDRRANTSSKYRAEQEFRRAVGLVNQGRIAEGMDGFRNALTLDPGHEAARQTLIALLLEAKRVDEAATVLQNGLAANPDNTAFAMLLARIMVERNDVSGALFVLQRHAAPPDRNPDFHAFAAALYQRLGRHKEAIDQYQAALQLAPSAGVWWVGLGISFQAAERPKEALEAYTRARSSGNLAPELLGFVDQRLKQLQ